jgi:rhodanese-related sulfurtransferase
MSDTSIKPRVLELLSFARERERKLITTLSDVERERKGAPDAWAAKDRLASIARWKELQTTKLAQAVRGETPPDWRNEALTSAINRETFERYVNSTFAVVERDLDNAYHDLVTQVERLSDVELTDPERYAWAEGEALWQETLGNGLWYPFTQMLDLMMDRSDHASAEALQDALIATVRAADLPGTLGSALYNATCFYAKFGWRDKALALLPEALHLRPNLLEWSRHDADLASVREDPRYQALLHDPDLLAAAPSLSADDLISPAALAEALNAADPPLVIDVRGPSEYAEGHVAGAINIPLGQLERRVKSIPTTQPIATYCNMHHRGVSRGERAAALLRERGYQARAIDGGYPAWEQSGLPVA